MNTEKEKSVPVTITFTVKNLNRINAIAEEFGMPRATFVKFALNQFINEHDKKKI